MHRYTGAVVTIYQVAEAAGVSPSTVSNYLNGRVGRMQAGTRTRIEQAITRLGYRPNQAARQLRTGRTRVIGLVVPSVANPFWGSFARHLEGAALAEGYRVLLCNSERDPERERSYLEELWDDGVRGVVLCSALPSLAHATAVVERGMHLVAFDRIAQPDDPPGLTDVAVDNALGMALATRHLLELGHRRFAFVSGSLRSVNRAERFRGFRGAIEAAGLSLSDFVVWPAPEAEAYGDVDLAGLGRAAVAELLARPRPPTAIVAINDLCALGVCAGVRDAGLTVGTDISVTGFDDIMLADLVAPPLTTVRQPLPQLAAAAFSQLRQRVEGETSGPGQSVLLRPDLIVRASTAPHA
ncbi:LacI family DNA-binding transcriptional regulator [Amycolatopsis benzoatilytica]|uniref:LacI family DNA-binding transcriptional regulator n=1 Tax=Amycolatopsis benzoatilytica TaxID=346045 RepID=UPI00039A5DBC|nr:LacI family DNA-binding transcriptional regulator [Amycolatopsis benzoatilytica]